MWHKALKDSLHYILTTEDCVNLPLTPGLAAHNERHSSVMVCLWIMRTLVSAAVEAEIQTKSQILQILYISFSCGAITRWFHTAIHGTVVQSLCGFQWRQRVIWLKLHCIFFISCSHNDLLPYRGGAVSGEAGNKEWYLRQSGSSQTPASMTANLLLFECDTKRREAKTQSLPCSVHTIMLHNFQYHGWLRGAVRGNMC